MTGQERQMTSGRIMSAEEAAQRLTRAPRDTYDVIVIGGGSAGLPAASLAAALGAKVALVEREKLGGECLYTGCVPSKALLHVGRVAHQVRRAASLGLSAQLGPVDLRAVAARVRQAVDDVYHESDAPEHYQAQGIDVVIGAAQFVAPTRIMVNGQTISGQRILLATGSGATIPPIPGLSEVGYITNETVFTPRLLPERLVIIGGGPIGCELGQAFARLGSHVTILQRPDRLLPRDDADAAALLRARLQAEGVVVVTGAAVVGAQARDGRKVVRFQTASGAGEVVADELLVAIGRTPHLAGLNLEAGQIAYDPKKGVTVDDHMRTSNPQVYAAGDVTGGYLFTHAAALQSRAAIRNMLFPGPAQARVDERVMPWATFTEPEVAQVGLTEAEARGKHGAEARVYSQPMREIDRAVTEDEPEGFIKLICTPRGDLLGATVVGPGAGDIINELAVAMQQGIGLGGLATTTHVYPTVALGIQQAAGKFSIEQTAQNVGVKLLRRLNG